MSTYFKKCLYFKNVYIIHIITLKTVVYILIFFLVLTRRFYSKFSKVKLNHKRFILILVFNILQTELMKLLHEILPVYKVIWEPSNELLAKLRTTNAFRKHKNIVIR